ncbi:hypothetical protein Ddc_10754 [Ditylenchus destructor]|nr:hypothetical protein Ddc_10754 [Ditylenchus destructor]
MRADTKIVLLFGIFLCFASIPAAAGIDYEGEIVSLYDKIMSLDVNKTGTNKFWNEEKANFLKLTGDGTDNPNSNKLFHDYETWRKQAENPKGTTRASSEKRDALKKKITQVELYLYNARGFPQKVRNLAWELRKKERSPKCRMDEKKLEETMKTVKDHPAVVDTIKLHIEAIDKLRGTKKIAFIRIVAIGNFAEMPNSIPTLLENSQTQMAIVEGIVDHYRKKGTLHLATYQDLDEVTLEETYLKKRSIVSLAPDDHTKQPSDMKMNTDEVTLVYAVGSIKVLTENLLSSYWDLTTLKKVILITDDYTEIHDDKVDMSRYPFIKYYVEHSDAEKPFTTQTLDHEYGPLNRWILNSRIYCLQEKARLSQPIQLVVY